MGTSPTIQLGAVAPIEIKEVGVWLEGHELVSKKLVDIVQHILINNEVHEYDCIQAIVFSPDTPEEKYGNFDTDTKIITINLQKQFEFAVDTVKEDAELAYLSLRGHIWFGLLKTIFHEVCHAMAFAIDPETMLGDDRETIENSIDEEANGHLGNMVRDYDIEPPEMADEPFFGPRYMEFFVKSIKESAEQWAINLNATHGTGFIWKHDEAVCNTFRDWYRASYNFEGDDEWDNDPKPLELGDMGAVTSEKEIEIQVDIVEDKPGEAVEIEVEVVAISDIDETSKELVDTVAATEPTPIVLSNEVEPLTGIDAETMALLHMDDGGSVEVAVQEAVIADPVVSGESTVAEEPAQVVAHVQQELPLKVETSSELCRSCNIVLTADAKFCASCGTGIVVTPMPALPSIPEVATVAHPQAAPQPAQFSSGANRAMRHDLPNHDHTAELIRACVGEVISRCYSHIFSKCGYLPGQNPSFAPELRNAITEPVSVVGIPCVDQILIGMDSIDPLTGAFTWCVPPVGSMIRGKTTKNQGLPSYTLYFNFNGHEAKRLVIPQNQWKLSKDGASYSGPAQRAQQGAMIVWLIDGDDSTAGKKWRAKIENGSLEWMI